MRCRADDYPLSVGLCWRRPSWGTNPTTPLGGLSVRASSKWENSRFFNKRAFDQAHAFYERYGGITIVAARFMPFLRTFVPFVAAWPKMTRARFMPYDALGGALWVGGVITVGYFFGNIPG